MNDRTNVEALKRLYVALGGKATDVADLNTSSGVIDAIAGVAAKAIELPKVTADDNGKVLKVVDGAWAVGTDEISA